MSASLVGSEMCIRDRTTRVSALVRCVLGFVFEEGYPEALRFQIIMALHAMNQPVAIGPAPRRLSLIHI